ncbi:uncharacterized protein LOC144173457 [Haemaphysalis longicornis]
MGGVKIFVVTSQLFLFVRAMPQPRDNVPASEPEPRCIDPNGIHETSSPGTKYVFNCSCTLDSQQPGIYTDGTRCWRQDYGYNKEPSMEEGRCKDGKCVLLEITRGCKKMETRMRNKPVDEKHLPTGCTFRCENRKTKKLEYGYYPVGHPCWHIEKATGAVRGTCRKVHTEVLCMTKVPGC